MKIIISCGSKKLNPSTPIQAYKMYQGTFYKAMLNLAQTYATEENIYILSAGYGLLKSNDLILPYDIKMTPKLAKHFKLNNIVQFDGLSLVGKVYEQAITGKVERILPVEKMGYLISRAIKLTNSRRRIATMTNLKDGNYRELLKL